MIMAGDFRKGVTVEIDGQVWSVVDFQHVKPGKGAAFGFLFACFGVLLYTFIRDTAPAEKRRGSKETA